MMNPFIIWLNKSDLDNLLTMLVTSDSLLIKNNNLTGDKLATFTQKLIQQNGELLSLLKKIELAPPHTELIVNQVRTEQKCKIYQKHLEEISTHCSIHNVNAKHSPDSLKLLGCNNCGLKNNKKIDLH